MDAGSANGGPLVFKCTCTHSCNGSVQPALSRQQQRPSPRNIKAGKCFVNTTVPSFAPAGKPPSCCSASLIDANEYLSPVLSSLDSEGNFVTREPNTEHNTDLLGSPRPLRSDLASNVSYELSEDLRAKEIELTERCYGGRLRAQRAARIIQNCYRDYRLRAEYARLRLEKCVSRKFDSDSLPAAPAMSGELNSFRGQRNNGSPPRHHDHHHHRYHNHHHPKLHSSSGSLEDLVLEQAYVDWALKAATAQAGCTLSDSTGPTSASERTTSDDNCSATVSFSSNTSTELHSGSRSDGVQTTAISDGTEYVNGSGYRPVSKSLCSTSTPFLTCNCCLARTNPISVSALSCELQRRRPSPARKQLSSPAASTPRSDPNLVNLASLLSSTSTATAQYTCQANCTRSVHMSGSVPIQHQQQQLHCCHCNNSTATAAATGLPKSGLVACSYATPPPKVIIANHPQVTTSTSSRHLLVTTALPFDQNKFSGQAVTCQPIVDGNNSSNQLRVPSGSVLIAVPTGTNPHHSRTHPHPHQLYTQQTLPTHPHLHRHYPHHPQPPVHQSSSQALAGGHTRNASLPQNHLVHLTTAASSLKTAQTRLVIPTVPCHVHAHQPSVSATDGPVASAVVAVQPYNPQSQVHQSTAASQQIALAKHQARQLERRRKRVYRIGLNIFNKSPLKGIEFLIKHGFLDCTPETVSRFLLTRKGLSRVAIGDYLGNTKDELAMATTRQFMRELDFREQEVDEALRSLLSCFRTPGESQKIVHLLTEFQAAYVEQNSARVRAHFRNADSVMVLAYAIVMLHTDMYSPNVRPQSKMTREEFVRNLRGVDAGEDLDRNLLLAIYDRIQQCEMSVAPDHTDQVRKIQQHLTGPLRPLNLALPQRRLVCYCRLYEVPDKSKRERPGAHQREVFLFNDLLLITKAVQKKRRDRAIAYQVRVSLNLLGVRLVPFETAHHPHGIELLLPVGENSVALNSKVSGLNPSPPLTPDGRARILVTLNTKTLSDRARFMEDLQECIIEVTEMDRVRIEDEVAKQMQQKTRLSKQLSNHCTSSAVNNTSNGAMVPYAYLNSHSRSSEGQVRVLRSFGDDRLKRSSDWASHARLPASVRAKTVPREFEQVTRAPATTACAIHPHSDRPLDDDRFVHADSRPFQDTALDSYAQRPAVLDPTKQIKLASDNNTDETQRLSSDSGLLADLETPTSQSSRVLGSTASSYSPT